MKQLTQRSIRLALSVVAGAGVWLGSNPAQAAESITLMVGPLNRSIYLSDFETLASEKTATGDLATALKIAKQSPEAASKLLTQEIPFDLVQADRILTSPIGDTLLAQIGKVMAPRSSNQVGDKAMRAAILLSLSDDGKLSILEVLRRYPTNARLNVNELRGLSSQLKDLPNLLKAGFGGLNPGE